MYKQTLYKVLDNYIDSKVLKHKNRYKKWEYGYNEEHDVIIISKTGEIGEVYEIQNLKVALPKQPENVTKFDSDKFERIEMPKSLSRIKTIFDWEEYQLILKKNGMTTLIKNLSIEKKVFGFITKALLLTLLVLITCTCSGPRLMLGSQTFEKPIANFSYSGQPVLQTIDVTVCPISRIDVQVFRLWPVSYTHLTLPTKRIV